MRTRSVFHLMAFLAFLPISSQTQPDIRYNDEYRFTGRIYMQMEQYQKNEIIKMDYYTYFSCNARNTGIEVKAADIRDKDKGQIRPTVFIFDGENRCFLVLTESGDSKSGIISTIPSDSAIAAQSMNTKGTKKDLSTVAGRATVSRTGKTRTIAGYKCDEYKIVPADENGSQNVWMTKDVRLKADNRYWGKAGVPTFAGYPEFEGLIMLAMESFDKDAKLDMKMETKEINNNYNHSISTVGFTFIKLNFGSAGKK